MTKLFKRKSQAPSLSEETSTKVPTHSFCPLTSAPRADNVVFLNCVGSDSVKRDADPATTRRMQNVKYTIFKMEPKQQFSIVDGQDSMTYRLAHVVEDGFYTDEEEPRTNQIGLGSVSQLSIRVPFVDPLLIKILIPISLF